MSKALVHGFTRHREFKSYAGNLRNLVAVSPRGCARQLTEIPSGFVQPARLDYMVIG
jgi:hypothetical protein